MVPGLLIDPTLSLNSPANTVLPGFNFIILVILTLQLPAVALLYSRLINGIRRLPAVSPSSDFSGKIDQVSIVIPTLNEADRIDPCLSSVSLQGKEVREIIIVDSYSDDGTIEKVKAAQAVEPRIQLIHDDPLPSNWVGRPWALHNGFLKSSPDSKWILGIDADTQLHPDLVAGLLLSADTYNDDLISLSPQFILKTFGEWILQPSLLITLIYRFGPSGWGSDSPERVMANGQCFLIRRSLLADLGGYSIAKQSFADDVTLARYAAENGASVSFLDGSKVLKVRMYDGLKDTWEGWGRSLDLKDACSLGQRWGDVAFLTAVQGLPIVVTPLLGLVLLTTMPFPFLVAAFWLNVLLVCTRYALLFAIAPSYDFSQTNRQSLGFWLSPLSDPAAVLRIFLSSTKRPTQWRSRQYDHFN